MRQVVLLVVGLLALASVAAASGGATQAQPRWVITDLGTLGGPESEAWEVNERGQVVGASSATGGEMTPASIKGWHAVLWALKR